VRPFHWYKRNNTALNTASSHADRESQKNSTCKFSIDALKYWNQDKLEEKGGRMKAKIDGSPVRTVISCFTSKLHVLISETLAARGSIWKFE
jgi:hypothetical protein